MGYSEWMNISEPSNFNGPAVYKIRLKDNKGSVVSIDRFLGRDAEGILCIGKTENMEGRRKRFMKGIQEGTVHSEARLIYSIRTRCKKFNEKYAACQYEYCFEKLFTSEKATAKEAKLIKEYIIRYGEAPPFNSSIPKRNTIFPAKKTSRLRGKSFS